MSRQPPQLAPPGQVAAVARASPSPTPISRPPPGYVQRMQSNTQLRPSPSPGHGPAGAGGPPALMQAQQLTDGMRGLSVSPEAQRRSVSPAAATAQGALPKARRSARAYHQEQHASPPATHGSPPAVSPTPHAPSYAGPSPRAQQQYLAPPGEPAQFQRQQNAQSSGQSSAHLAAAAGPSHVAGQPVPGYTSPQPPFQNPLQPQSNGARLTGPRPKIDPDQIPSPVAVQEQDQAMFVNEPFLTCSRNQVPLSNTEFTAVDQGNCNPRFLRLTTYSLPTTDDMAWTAQIPLGLVVQPFAQLKADEDQVAVADFRESGGPPRCQRCRAYINSWSVFIEGGQKFACNLCGAATEVPGDYFAHLDMSGRRMDLDQRPELTMGSVDFVVGKDYWAQESMAAPDAPPRRPSPINFIFAIDVSWSSSRCGLLKEVVEALKTVLFPDDGATRIAPGAKVAIITFDRTMHFYNLKPSLEQAQMLVVPDLEDVFLPLNDGLLVDPIQSRDVILQLLDSLPHLFAENQVAEAALGAPMKASLKALAATGGQVNIFQSSLPTFGPGALKHREDSKLYGTDKEKTLFSPQDPFYRIIAEECVDAGIGINLFLFPSQYIDVASLGVLPGLTGGDLFFHPRFDPVRDGRRVRAEIQRVVTRENAMNAIMRIRCSNGLRINEYFGNFFQRNVTDIEFGVLDADKAVAAQIKHEGKLDEGTDSYFQCAVLYTSSDGERRVRVHNIAVPSSSVLANAFRHADMDTTIAFVAKQSVSQTVSKPLREIRDFLTDTCVKTLFAYRKNCASSTSPGQLILPESFKLFPVYALALMKTKAFKGGPVASDVRTWSMRLLKGAGVSNIVTLIYPRMLAIHTLPEDAILAPDSTYIPPAMMRPSYTRMEPQGAYLIDNGVFGILWLGSGVSPKVLLDLYGSENFGELESRMTTLPRLPTRLSQQVRAYVSHIEQQRGIHLPVLMARRGLDGTEIEFSNLLVEDANNDLLGYVDYLCLCHKTIAALLEKKEKPDADIHSSIWH